MRRDRSQRHFETALRLIAFAVLAWSLVDWHGFDDFWRDELGARRSPIVLRVVAVAWFAADAVIYLRRRAARRRS